MVRVLGVDAEFVDRLAARTGHKLGPPLIAQQRAGLSHAIAHRIGQVNLLEELLGVRVECSTTHDETFHSTAEGFYHFFARSPIDQGPQARDCQRHFCLLHRGFDGIGIDFLHHQRHRDHHVGLDVTHRLEQRGGRRRLAQEIDGDTVDVGVDELDGQAVHVGQRQHRDDGLAGGIREMSVREVVGVRDGVIGEHHALRVARGARRVVDDGQVIAIVIGIRHMLGEHAVGILLIEGFLAVVPRIGQRLVLMPEDAVILDIDGSLEVGHLIRIHLRPDVIVNKQHHTVRMVGQQSNGVGMEVSQQRNRHTAIDIDAPERHGPPGAVACAQGNFVALVDAYSVKKDTELFNVDGQVSIGKSIAIVVTQGFLCPMVADGFLQILQIVPHIFLGFKSSNNAYSNCYYNSQRYNILLNYYAFLSNTLLLATQGYPSITMTRGTRYAIFAMEGATCRRSIQRTRSKLCRSSGMRMLPLKYWAASAP